MQRFRLTTVAIIGLAAACTQLNVRGEEAAEAAAPARAGDFTLGDTRGQQHSLADYKGQYVVLEWINHDCPFVKKHYDSNNMQNLQKAYGAKDVVWLSICSSAPGKQGYYEAEAWNKISQEKGAAATAVLLDPDGTVGRLYGAKVTPHIYIIDPDQNLIYQGAIDDIPSTNPGDIANSKNYVKETLDAAMAGQPVPRSATKPYGCSVKYP
jgi:hypothetical protein